MKAGRVALTVTQGTTFRRRFTWKAPVVVNGPQVAKDLTGWQARAVCRVGELRVLRFTTDDGSIVLGEDGTITLLAPPSRTAAATAGTGTWGLDVISPVGDRDTLLLGPVTILSQVGG